MIRYLLIHAGNTLGRSTRIHTTDGSWGWGSTLCTHFLKLFSLNYISCLFQFKKKRVYKLALPRLNCLVHQYSYLSDKRSINVC